MFKFPFPYACDTCGISYGHCHCRIKRECTVTAPSKMRFRVKFFDEMKKKGFNWKKIVLWIIGIWVLLLAVIQLVLSPAFLTRMTNRYAAEFIDGNVSFGKVSASVFRNFPNLNVTFNDFSVTYPAERFGASSERTDTLASFGELSVSLNMAALAIGEIHIPYVRLLGPVIYARDYGNGKVNWDILKDDGSQEQDSPSGIPSVTIDRISLKDSPKVVYNNYSDSLFSVLLFRKALFSGRISTKEIRKSRLGLSVDSLFLSGKLSRDTVSFGMEHFRIKDRGGKITVDAAAKVAAGFNEFGRVSLPLSVKGSMAFPEDSVFSVDLYDMSVNLSSFIFTADGKVKFKTDSLYTDINLVAKDCNVQDAIDNVGKLFWKDLQNIRTDAEIDFLAKVRGWYVPSAFSLPEFDVRLDVPRSSITYRTLDNGAGLELSASLTGSGSDIDMVLDKFSINGKGFDMFLSGKAGGLLDDDPLFSFDGRLDAELDTLANFIQGDSGIVATGKLTSRMKGNIRKSQLSPLRFAQADLTGFVNCDRLEFESPKDSLSVYIDSLDVTLASVGNTYDKSVQEGERMLAGVVENDSLYVSYKDAITLYGNAISLKAQNSAEILNPEDTSLFLPFGGKFDAGRLVMVDKDSSMIDFVSTENIFKISPQKDNPQVPVLTLKSSSGLIYARGPVSRIGTKGLKIDAVAAMNSIKRKSMVKNFMDSLQRRYPDIPRDSLYGHLMKNARQRPVPEWLSEDDFRKKDIDFSVSSTVKKYFREWDASLAFASEGAFLATPYFPLRTSLNDFRGSMTNNEIALDGFSLRTGTSRISATGKITGIRRALLRNGILDVELNLSSSRLNLNELMGAYTAGSRYVAENFSAEMMDMSDDEYENMVVTDTLANVVPQESSLLVIPSNINAKISLDGKNVTYSRLSINEMKSEILMKERCVQMLNTEAVSDIGTISLDGFYSTLTKTNIKTGFDLNFKDVTAEKLIDLIPAVDSILPMLKSFKGNLNVELAATASLDTCMNILMPTAEGILKINGTDLTVDENEAFRQVAKKLKFKDTHQGRIDRMSVEGVLADNKLEIFPFILDIDRYCLAVSGVQNLDMSFKYHVSILESPLIFRVGIDLYGTPDKFKFKIGKAKYKNRNVPVFSEVLENARLDLRNAITNVFGTGAEQAVKENDVTKILEEHKKSINYVSAEDIQLDSLSTEIPDINL